MDYIRGTIKLDWAIPEEDLAIQPGSDPLTYEQTVALCDRIEEALAAAIGECSVYLDGKDKPPVRVSPDLCCADIEIDEGPVNGMLDDLRET